jgi:transcription initiation factor IIE alpha subunit
MKDKEVARYLIEKYGSDKFIKVLEIIKQQQKESAQDGRYAKQLQVLQREVGEC